MDQVDIELDFHHQIDQPGHEMAALQEDEAPETQVELSSHCDDAEHGEYPQGSPDTAVPPFPSTLSDDAASASEPAGEVFLEEEVSENVALDFEAGIGKNKTVGVATEETGDAEGITVEENAMMVMEAVDSVPVKRKRGRPRKNPEARAPPARKKERDDICFVCFDRKNPNLVACSRRGCYKAYHPACVNRDEDFFRSKSKWNCGWHICSTCQKAAHYMCYTCTTSYCKECVIDESKYVCVRGTYGFCQSCNNTVTLIELNKVAFEKKDGSDFDDTDSFTYLFKAYWLDQKGKLSLTSEELNNAKHPYSVVPEEDSSDELYDVNEDQGYSSESSSGDHKSRISSKKNVRSRSQSLAADKNHAKEADGGGTIMFQEASWASKELLELVAHMRNGDQSFISQFDVQALLLDYIKKYNLRDPRKKSQIICDLRLQNLFGKERVGHFEMLKLLESHFLSKEALQVVSDGNQAETLDPDKKLTDDVEEGDTFARVVSEKRRKNRKRTEEIEPQANIDDYAAVDVHNITQIFLRRSLVEELLDDIETFNDKVVGSFVRIRISNAGQRQDLYRLVQVVGTQESSKPYKVGKKTTDFVLEILNLDKKETSTIDSISNQDFTVEECQRLRQSIKCGLINRLKVGYIQDKAKVLHTVRMKDSIEAEKLRLSHLRDRASETGRRKQLRECVEKLQLLNNPEERRRRLNELSQIHPDPKMDPEHESSESGEDEQNLDYHHNRSKKASSIRKGRELIPRGRAGGTIGNTWNGTHKTPNFNRRRMPSGEVAEDKSEMHNNMDASFTSIQTPSPVGQQPPHAVSPEINEVDKVWHYQDPSKNIQGPFSLSQLRKWNTTGYFPPDLRIWITSEVSHLLGDVLAGSYYKDTPPQFIQQNRGNWNAHQNMQQPTLDGLPSPSPVWSSSAISVSVNKYRSFENDCPSPTPSATERKDSSKNWPETPVVNHEPAPPLGTPDSSFLASHSAGVPNDSASSEFQINLSPIRKVETGFQAMDPASVQKQQAQVNPQNASNVESSLPSPTPNSCKNNTWVIDAPSAHRNVSSQNQNANASWGAAAPPQGNAGWVAPAFGNANNNTGWGTLVQVNATPNTSWGTPVTNANTGWGTPAQVNANANTGWGAPVQGNVNANTGWGAPVQGNMNANTGWVTPVQGNANTGWGTPGQGNANTGWGTPGQGNVNTGWGINSSSRGWGNANSGGSGDSIPRHEDDGNGKGGWGSAYGNRNGGWRPSDRDSNHRHFDHEGRNLRNSGRSQAGSRGDGQRGVCKFYESGHCKKGRSCQYLHTQML